MLLRFGFVCTAVLAGALVINNAPARAQTGACVPDDLRCRVERLEARLAVLESQKSAAVAPKVIYQSPTEFVDARRTCKVNCVAEANAVCIEHGYTGGKPEDWDRPRSGPVVMTKAKCDRPQ